MNNEKNLPPVVTVESLKETYGDDAIRVYQEITDIGGFGDLSQGDYTTGYPPLSLVGLKPEAAEEIAKVLAKKPDAPHNPAQANKIPATTPATGNKDGNQ